MESGLETKDEQVVQCCLWLEGIERHLLIGSGGVVIKCVAVVGSNTESGCRYLSELLLHAGAGSHQECLLVIAAKTRKNKGKIIN